MDQRGDPPTPLRRLNLNLVYALDAILHAPTLTQAGRAIRLTQPAMSLALRKLRGHFDDDLVVYHANGRRLTALAEALTPRVRRFIHDAQDLFAFDIDFDPATARRTITLAAPESVEIAFLTRLAPELMREGPGLTLHFVPLDTMSGSTSLANGVDLAIVPESMLDPRCRHMPLFRQGLSCLVWDGHPTIHDSITADQYVSARHAGLSPALEQSLALDDLLHPLMAERHVVTRTNRFSSLPQLVIGTDLVITVNDWLAQYLAYLHPLRVVGTPIPGLMMLYAQWEAHRDDDPVITWLCDHLRRTVTRWSADSAHQSG